MVSLPNVSMETPTSPVTMETGAMNDPAVVMDTVEVAGSPLGQAGDSMSGEVSCCADSVKIETIKTDINMKGMLLTQTWTELLGLLGHYQAELVSWESRLLVHSAEHHPDTGPGSGDVRDLQTQVRRYEVKLDQAERKLQLAQHNLVQQTQQVFKLQSQVQELSEKNIKLTGQVTKMTVQMDISKLKKHKKKKRKEGLESGEASSPGESALVGENGHVSMDSITTDYPITGKEDHDSDDLLANLTPNSDCPPVLINENAYFINSTIDYEENESHDPEDVTQPLYSIEPIKIKQEPEVEVKKRRTKKKDGPCCPVCGKSCGNEPALQQHMLLHSAERPFMCRLCGWRFQRRENLIAHSRVHSGERPYKCDHCCRAFTQISARRRHMKTAHGTEPDVSKKEDKTEDFRNSIEEILSNI